MQELLIFIKDNYHKLRVANTQVNTLTIMYIFSKSHKVDIKFAIMQHVSGIYYNRQRMQSIGN